MHSKQLKYIAIPCSPVFNYFSRPRVGDTQTLSPAPFSEAAVLQFVVDHVGRRNADGELVWELPPSVDQSTVRHRVAVPSTAHRLKQLPNPCEQPAIRTVLSRAARAAVKRGERPRKKTAITLAELEAMLATCDDSLEGVRDRALLCCGFASGGRRRSEIAAADMRDLKRIGDTGYRSRRGWRGILADTVCAPGS